MRGIFEDRSGVVFESGGFFALPEPNHLRSIGRKIGSKTTIDPVAQQGNGPTASGSQTSWLMLAVLVEP